MSAGPEDVLQIQIARYLNIVAPDLVWYAVPNGGFRNPREARKLKDMGVRPGVADLAFVLPTGAAAFIELKAGKGRQSPTQMIFQEACDRTGAAYAICRSLAEVETTLRRWGCNLRNRSPE